MSTTIAGSPRPRRECPVGCGRTVQVGHLMCGADWRKVPPDLQSEVYRTWRAYQANPAAVDKGLAYDAARDAAIAAARGGR